MNPRWRALIESAFKTQRVNHAQVRRLIGLLDLEPPLDPKALGAVLDDEAGDQHARGLAALAALLEIAAGPDADPNAAAEADAARGAHAALTATASGSASAGAIPRDQLAGLRAAAPPRTAAVLDQIIARHDAFERRLGWLLRPTAPEELARLDPRRDCNQIYHAISYDFRVEQKLFALLFELAAVMIPYSSVMLASTGELTLRGYKRINDTVMFFSNMMEWGLDSRRGRDAIARVNQIHGRYSLPHQLFRFILSGVMFIPLDWNERLGWRRFTEVERRGWFHNFVEMGRAMNVDGIGDDFDQMRAWWQETVERAGETSAVGRKLFHQVIIQTLATYPAELRRPILAAVFCGMADEYRQVLDIPPPPPPALARVRETLRLVGAASNQLPRAPWIRSLQTHPLYRRVDEIGVGDRSPHLPRIPGAADNAGFPTGQRPIGCAGEVPDAPPALPEIARHELARHHHAEDAWIAVGGYVYDVTRFLHDHPGGRDVLAAHLGADATAAFRRVGHSDGARIVMANFRIGRLAGAPREDLAPAAHEAERSRGGALAGRRIGRGKEYRPRAWDDLLDGFERHTALYERARLDPDRDPDVFPVELPGDL